MAGWPWAPDVLKVCNDCMIKAEVESPPAAYLFDRKCHICGKPHTLVYCCTNEYMDLLMRAKK